MENSEFTNYLELIEMGLKSLDDTSLFQKILKDSATVLRLNDSRMAAEIQMDRTTINRWRSGASAPNPIMRKSVYIWLKRNTNQMRKTFDKNRKEILNSTLKESASVIIESP